MYTWSQGVVSPTAAAAFTAWLLGTMRVQFSLVADIRSSVKFVETLPSGEEGTTLEVNGLSRTWVTRPLKTEWTASINGTVVASAKVGYGVECVGSDLGYHAIFNALHFRM